jgi:hypothetical protein
MNSKYTILLFFLCLHSVAIAQQAVQYCEAGDGWAGNTINTAIFRKNSLVSHQDMQYVSYYNPAGYLTLGKRKLNDCNWEIKQSQYQGNVRDAHNVISIMVDGEGYLHVAWDHHNGRLRYTKSAAPGSLELLEEMPMVGTNEKQVTYPEFYKMPNGDVLFLYRDGASGSGNLIMNRYDIKTEQWVRIHHNLISGEGKRNAYWQAFVDHKGTIHLSWVWRESPDVASNHDMAYACSKDGGVSWQNSRGEIYTLPITAKNAEYAAIVPQKSELINQTAMAADEKGNPFIVSYWRTADSAIPQYKLIYLIKSEWKVKSLDFRKTAFSLSGVGTKRIPIARPQVMVKGSGKKASVLLLFRDEERGNKPSVLKINRLVTSKYEVFDLKDSSLGSWEPSYDTELWRMKKTLHLFIQNTEQADGEGVNHSPAQKVGVLIWKPRF